MLKTHMVLSVAVLKAQGLPKDPKELKEFDFNEMMKGVDPNSWKSKHFVQSSTTATCATNVNRLKNGPVNIPEIIYKGTQDATYKYTDDDFSLFGALYNNYLQSSTFKTGVDTKLGNGTYRWGRLGTEFSTATIINSSNTVEVNHVRQGGAGTCYFMSSLGAAASKPATLLDTLLTKTQNSAGIVGIKFYIRGKPWVVATDQTLVMQGTSPNNLPVYAQLDKTKTVAWGPLYEKTWCKVIGTYDLCDGGFFENAIRSLSGLPVETFKTSTITNQTEAEAFWTTI